MAEPRVTKRGQKSRPVPPLGSDQDVQACLDEVETELRAIGDAAYGERVRLDRGSKLEHLGIPFPVLRNRVNAGFSFSGHDETTVFRVWDHAFRHSRCGDVLFAAIEHYLPRLKKGTVTLQWSSVAPWVERVDNWCHADALANLYSWVIAADVDRAWPNVTEWNQSANEWLRRVSLVNLVHYSGKNAVYLSPERVFPLVRACVGDLRPSLQTAVGWVLREMSGTYRDETAQFLAEHADTLGAKAFARAIEKLPEGERQALTAQRRRPR